MGQSVDFADLVGVHSDDGWRGADGGDAGGDLDANYIASRLEAHFPVLYKGAKGRVAHECIVDMRHFRKSAGITVADVAKRLMDLFSRADDVLACGWDDDDRADGERVARRARPLLRGDDHHPAGDPGHRGGPGGRGGQPAAPGAHTAEAVCADVWERGYSRQQAAFPARWVRNAKFWPAVGRVDDAFGDRNLVCACPPVEEFDQGDDLIS